MNTRLIHRGWALWLGVAVLLSGALLAGCKSRQATPSQPPSTQVEPPTTGTTPQATAMVGEPAPDFHLVDTDGKTHTLSDYRGKILVMDFWATYCKPCVEKLHKYESIYQSLKDQNVAFLGFSMDEKIDVIKGWLQENEVSFPLGILEDKTKAAYFPGLEIVPIPQVRIIDRTGTLRYAFGADGTAEQVENAVKELLAKDPQR